MTFPVTVFEVHEGRLLALPADGFGGDSGSAGEGRPHCGWPARLADDRRCGRTRHGARNRRWQHGSAVAAGDPARLRQGRRRRQPRRRVGAGSPRDPAPDDAECSGGRYLDPFTALAWLAGQTARIGLGTGVLNLPYRPALPTAKAIATVQQLALRWTPSAGRRRIGESGSHASQRVGGACYPTTLGAAAPPRPGASRDLQSLETWLLGTFHGVSLEHLQRYLVEFT